MPPVPPIVPEYPFQHICSDYLKLHGKSYVVVVDRFSNWYNIYIGKGGATSLVDVMTKLFQDLGVPETITSDGGASAHLRQVQHVPQTVWDKT